MAKRRRKTLVICASCHAAIHGGQPAPSGATTSYTYDPAGNGLTRTDPNGITTTWTYTPLGLAASVSYSGGSAHQVTESYDADGIRTAMTDASGSSTYTPDPFGELTSVTNGAGQATSYAYDADGQVTGITYPLPPNTWATTSTVTYGYDHAGLLTSATDFTGNTITIGSTADGLPNSAALAATGDTITTTYDNTDAPSAITLKNSTTTLQAFAYSDTPAGTILSETDTPSFPANTGRVHLRPPRAGHLHDPGDRSHAELRLRPLRQPHHAAHRSCRQLRPRRRAHLVGR